MVTDGSVGTEIKAVNDVLTNIAQRVFSASNVLALKCAVSMQADFVKEMGSMKNDIFVCMTDFLNYLPQTNDFIALEMAVLKAVVAWRLGSASVCIKYITATSSSITTASAFGNCLNRVSCSSFY